MMCCDKDFRDEHDYDSMPFAIDKDENRRGRATKAEKDVEVAFDRYEEPIVHELITRMVEDVTKSDDIYFNSCTLRDIFSRGLSNLCRERGVPRIIVSSNVCTVIVRIIASDYPEFRPYARISQAECDHLLINRDPVRFGWLRQELYGIDDAA